MFLAIGVVLLLPGVALAHPESISTVELQFEKQGAHLTLTLQTRDLNGWFPPGNQTDYKTYVLHGLSEQAGGLFEFQADGQDVPASDINVHSDKPGCIRVELFFKYPPATQLVTIGARALDKLPSGHQQLLCAEDRRMAAKPGDDPQVLLEQPLNAEQDTAQIQLSDASATPPTSQPSR